MRYSRGLKAISLSMAFVMLFTNTAPLKAYAAGLQEEVQDAMAGETVQVSPEVRTSVEPGSEPQVLALEPTLNPEEIEPQVGSGQDGAQQDNVEATQSPAPATTPAATETPAPATTPEPTVAPTETPEPTATPAPTEMPEATATPKPTAEPSPTETPAVTEIENEIATSESANSLTVPQDAVIEIGTYEELQLLGTGETVDGVTYAADGQYTIAQDIELPSSTAWTLPENFTGRIAPEEPSEDRTVYDAESDTIYVYHRFQLAVMAQENAAEEPVMDGDATAETFGMGQLIYPNGAEQPYLTYSPEHHYVISTQFCSDVPVSTYASTVDVPGPKDDGTRQYEGRDFPGQVVKTIDGVRYILIGNEEQLRAIGTDADVNAAVYQAKLEGIHWNVDTMDNGEPIMLYGGDADLNENQNGTKDYAFGEIEKKSGTLTGRCGVNQETGLIDANLDIENSCYGLKYTADANYIIFRNITLTDPDNDPSNGNWTPKPFSGTMLGAVSPTGEQSSLWVNSDDSFASASEVSEDNLSATVSNISVIQTTAIEVNKYIGVGFFSTISNETNVDNIGVSSGQVVVKDLNLNNVTVRNKTSETKNPQTILSALTSGLGWLVGGLGDLLIGALTFGQVKLNLHDTLSALLNARAAEPTRFATGTLAGRIEGDVRVENCHVTNATVYNQNDYTGGFVGYSVGVTKYDGLSSALGVTVKALASLLNAIPGLGLGDLITILLDKALPVGSLIPTGYYNPIVRNCVVENLNSAGTSIGAANTNYNGGFIGLQIGTRIENCSVTKGTNIDSKYTVQAKEYGGGFAGLTRDAEIKGLLSSVGIDLVRVAQPQSLLLNCNIEVNQVTVEGENHLGGFSGALANSYAVNDKINATLSINGAASGTNIGGFAGTATVGWVSNLGAGSATNNSLLTTVKDLLLGLLSGENANKEQAGMLLSLVGIQPSAIMGCQINPDGADGTGNTNTVTVEGGSYVGGIVGRGDGVYLTESSEQYLKQLPLWKWHTDDNAPPAVTAQGNVLNGLTKVSASKDYAGGIAGSLGGASVGGLLNSTVGLGEFLGFTVDGTTLDGAYTVAATGDYAGGAFGMAMAGKASNIAIDGITRVTARNNAGGFLGLGGPGSLASAGDGGLTINLLGLNNLVNLSNVLSVIPGLQMTLTDCSVTGGGEDFTVEAKGGDGSTLDDFAAGGFIGRCNSTDMTNCHVSNLLAVTAPTEKAGTQGESGFAGGFVGISRNDDLADVLHTNDEGTSIGKLISVDQLLGAAPVLTPEFKNCTVQFADLAQNTPANVSADVAGGFAADFQSGTVDNSEHKNAEGKSSPYAVYNITQVTGRTYAGGFAGKLYSGALANAGGGVSILDGLADLDLSKLLTVVNAYVPVVTHAGVNASDVGLAVAATDIQGENGDLNAGSAGGFAGYASGAQISTSDVKFLRHTTVKDPVNLTTADVDLVTDGSSYYGAGSTYAVTGGRYAGGYIGKIDIGSAASVGGGLKILDSISLSSVLEALNVVVTTIEHSDVYGAAGGYAVRADATVDKKQVGHAGGFAGVLYGGHIQDSQAHNFSHIIGRQTAGGYVGEMQPGDVANVLGDGSILDNLVVNVDDLLSGLQVFVPTIRNSSTDSVPCGGVVWAQVSDKQAKTEGMAGGYVGHSEGGQIRGLDTETWHTVASDDNAVDTGSKVYEGPTSLCRAERIRTVFGSLYAGGYTGFMEAADTAEAGGLSLLGGLIKVDNLLSVLKIVYPIQTNTAVYGPLAGLDANTWNSWVDAIGQYGGYGFELAQAGKVNSQDELNEKLSKYIYGYEVYTADDETARTALASAGGYVGLMRSGTLTNCMAYDARLVKAPGAAGGYAGRMETGGAANFGEVDLLKKLQLNIGQLVNVAQVFVPAVKNSSVQGYASGLTVTATGTNDKNADAGYAGGYLGAGYGAQIQLNDDDKPTDTNAWIISPDSEASDPPLRYPAPTASCNVTNLRRVSGRSSVGGYVGLATAASVAKVNTNASSGLLQGILDKVIGTAGDLVDLLPATVTTIHKANVSAADPAWGFVVDGAYTGETTEYAPYAGGFVGQAQAAVIGEKPEKTQAPEEQPGTGEGESSATQNEGALDTSPLVTVTGLRQVDGGLYAGGFVGLADVKAVAEVGGKTSGGEQTTILDSLLGGLLDNAAELGAIDVADVLRTYVRRGSVTGVAEGYRVQAHTNPQNHEGTLSEIRWPGCAGGFAGAVLNGTVGSSTAANVATVKAPNYTGGFIGHMGKSGLVDVDKVDLLQKLLDTTVGVVDLFGTQVQDCTVTGIAQSADTGIEVVAQGGQQPIAGGFAGYADLGRIDRCHVGTQQPEDGQSWNLNGGLKLVQSSQVAGGFIGQTDMAYLVSAEVNSTLVEALLAVLGTILETLYVDEDGLESLKLVNAYLGIINLEVLGDGNLLKLELLGIPITVSINKELQPGEQGVAVVTIGDSEVSLSYQYTIDKDGKAHVTFDEDSSDITINLIKGNRTELDNCTVTGVADGYDVFGGGAGQSDDQPAVRKDKTGSAGGFVGYNHEGKISNSTMYYCDVVKGTAGFVGPFTGYNDLRSVYFFNNMTSLEGQGNQYSIYRVNDPSLQQIQTADQKPIPVDYEQDTATGTTYDRYIVDHIVDFQDIVDPNTSGDDTNKGAAVQDTFKALDGAVMTGGDAENRNLDAYQADGGKAVLMLDTPTESNPGTMVPEPGVMGDPCSKKVDLKVQKIWDDWFNLWHSRPEDGSITLTIYQQEFTLQEKNEKTPSPQYPAQVENPEEGVTMVWAPAPGADGVKKPYAGSDSDDLDADGKLTLTEADQESTWSAVWRKVLKDAPIYTFIDEDDDKVWDEDEKIAYYVYTVVEENVPAGYTVSYDFYNPIDAGDYELTVTNKLNIPLPDTGAGGDAMFVAVGVGILLLGLTLTKRRRPRKGER